MRDLNANGPLIPMGRRFVACLSRGLVISCRAVLGLIIFVAIAINFSNVVGRYFFGTSIGWTEEVLTYLLIWSVFVGSVLVTLNNQHLRVNMIDGFLPGWARQGLETLILLSMILFCAFAALQSRTVVVLMAELGQHSSTAGIPMAWAHAGVYAGLAMMALAASLRLAEQLLGKASCQHDREYVS